MVPPLLDPWEVEAACCVRTPSIAVKHKFVQHLNAVLKHEVARLQSLCHDAAYSKNPASTDSKLVQYDSHLQLRSWLNMCRHAPQAHTHMCLNLQC